MSATGLEVFDKTLQLTHIWIDEVTEALGGSREDGWHVLGAVLRALRDRLPVGLSAHLSTELPLLLRGAYFDQWQPEVDNLKERSRAAFLDRIAGGLAGRRPIDPAEAARAVFAVIDRHLDHGQTVKIVRSLPGDIRALWPQNWREVKVGIGAA